MGQTHLQSRLKPCSSFSSRSRCSSICSKQWWRTRASTRVLWRWRHNSKLLPKGCKNPACTADTRSSTYIYMAVFLKKEVFLLYGIWEGLGRGKILPRGVGRICPYGPQTGRSHQTFQKITKSRQIFEIFPRTDLRPINRRNWQPITILQHPARDC